MVNLLFLFLLSSCTALTSFNLKPGAATLVSELASFLKVPLKVTLFVCWNEEKSYNFIREMHSPYVHRTLLVQIKGDSAENLAALDTLEPHQHLAVLDVGCPNTRNVLAGAPLWTLGKVRWVLLNKKGEFGLEELLGDRPITGNSEMYYFEETDDGEIEVRDVYRSPLSTEYGSSLIAIRRHGAMVDKRSERSVSVRRRNLQLLPIRLTLVYTSNFTLTHFDDYENVQIDSPNRTTYQLLKALLTLYLNATLERRFSPTWGYLNLTTGIWDGLCGDLINNQSDIGGSVLFMTHARLKQMDFLKLPLLVDLKFVYEAPNLSITNNIFQLPFDTNVWSCLLVLILFIGALFAGISLRNKRYRYTRTNTDDWLDAAFDAVPITLQQGSYVDAKTLPQRILVLVSLIGLMFMHVSFSAKIISLIQAPSERINSIHSLLHSRLEIGGHDVPYQRFYMSRAATAPALNAVYKQKISRKDGSLNMFPLEEGVAKLRNGLFAFHVLTPSAYHEVSETFDEVEKCNLRELTLVDHTIGYIPLQRNYTLREHFQIGFMKIYESGIGSREFNKFHQTKPRCVKGTVFRPLGVIDTRFTLEIVGFGFGMAAACLAGEMVWKRFQIWRVPFFEYVE